MVRIGIIGTGNWGRNHVRTFASLDGARLVRISDRDAGRLARVGRTVPGVETATDPDDVLCSDDIDAVVIATSAVTHQELAERALAAGKDVFVEKPLSLDPVGAQRLVATARRRKRILMVGHLLLYHPAVLALRDLVASGEIGEIRYMYGLRVNLGTVRSDENALWSLAPHDISVMNFLVGEGPVSVAARGEAWVRPGVEDVVFLNLRWRGGRMGQVQVSWLDPHKERKLTVVGDRKMVVFDDMHPSEKLRIYDKGVDPPDEAVGPGEAISVRFGEVRIPRVGGGEPLAAEARHFLECVASREEPRSGGSEGLDVVRVLAAATESLGQDGKPVRIRSRRAATGKSVKRAPRRAKGRRR